jgi:hemerythrin
MGENNIMALFTWTNKFSVNIKIIDEQHQKLIELINTLHDQMKKGITDDILKEILNGLVSYTKTHFATEEVLFDKYNYPDAKAHKEEHAILIRQVGAIKKEFDEGRKLLTIDLMIFLKEWLTSHILISDKNYTRFLNNQGIR